MYMAITPPEKVQLVPQKPSFKFRTKEEILKQLKYISLTPRNHETFYERVAALKWDSSVMLPSIR